jgi:ring-1,2-phenylacetyl-CoA epoxidase subunit PaaC
VLAQVISAATLRRSPSQAAPENCGRNGKHTEHLEPLLAGMQVLARAHPEATW